MSNLLKVGLFFQITIECKNRKEFFKIILNISFKLWNES